MRCYTNSLWISTQKKITKMHKKVFRKLLKLFLVIFTDDDEAHNASEFKAKLDKIMYQKGQDLENKRMIMVKKQLEIGKVHFNSLFEH